MASIVWVSLRKLANISFPPKILRVNKRNSKIGLKRWSVIYMSIKSFRRLPVSGQRLHGVSSLLGHLRLWGQLSKIQTRNQIRVSWDIIISLEFSSVSWSIEGICNDLIFSSDNSNFNGIGFSLYRNRFLHIVMSLLLSPEALDFMLSHSMLCILYSWNILNETNHSLVTMRIKLIIIASF